MQFWNFMFMWWHTTICNIQEKVLFSGRKKPMFQSYADTLYLASLVNFQKKDLFSRNGLEVRSQKLRYSVTLIEIPNFKIRHFCLLSETLESVRIFPEKLFIPDKELHSFCRSSQLTHTCSIIWEVTLRACISIFLGSFVKNPMPLSTTLRGSS